MYGIFEQVAIHLSLRGRGGVSDNKDTWRWGHKAKDCRYSVYSKRNRKCRAEIGNHVALMLGGKLEGGEVGLLSIGDWIKEALEHPYLERNWESDNLLED